MRTRIEADAPRPEAFPVRITPVIEADTGRSQALLLGVGWEHDIGHADLRDPTAFGSLVGRQPALAASATRVMLGRLVAVMAEADQAGHPDLPVILPLPAALLNPEIGTLALPNLVGSVLDRRQCARTVVLFGTVPAGAGQALRLLTDRGLGIAVTAAAAAEADPVDLFGWQRWGIVFPRHLVSGPAGVDSLTIQQTVSVIAGHGTRLIARTGADTDRRELARHKIHLTVDDDVWFGSVAESTAARTATAAGTGNAPVDGFRR